MHLSELLQRERALIRERDVLYQRPGEIEAVYAAAMDVLTKLLDDVRAEIATKTTWQEARRARQN